MNKLSNIETLEMYLKLMLEANKDVNLTAIRNIEDAKILHIEDSLNSLPLFRKYCMGKYGDIGTGCGFPGIALSIMSEEHVDLIDSSKKKMSTIQKIIEDLQISDLATTVPYRVEEVADTSRNSYNIVTSRAMTRLDSLLELASPLLEISGHLLAYKESTGEDEFHQAIEMQDIVGMKYLEKINYQIYNKQRFIYVFEKAKESAIELPRRIGKAQKNPLKRK